jgi:hypothetical protein
MLFCPSNIASMFHGFSPYLFLLSQSILLLNLLLIDKVYMDWIEEGSAEP